MKKVHAIIALASCLATTAHAEGTPQMPEGLLACSKLEDAAERVRCYDSQVAAMKKRAGGAESAPRPAAPAPQASPPTASRRAPAASAPLSRTPAPVPSQDSRSGTAQPPGVRQDSAARFGEEDLPQSQRPKTVRKHEMLESSITGVSKLGSDTFLFSLANGQVWRVDGNQMTFFRVGYPVHIERHSMGSYHMSSPTLGTKNWVYAKRVR